MRQHLTRRALPVLAATLAIALGTDVASAPAAPVAPHARHHLTAAERAALGLPHAAGRLRPHSFLRASWR